MKNHLPLSLALFLSISILGCEKNNPVNSTGITNVIVPLQTGNSWSFKGYEFDTLGSIIQNYEQVESISRDTTFLTQKYFAFPPGWCHNTDSGLVSIQWIDSVKFILNLVYKYPAISNQEYVPFADQQAIISNVDTLLQVSAGNFHCIKYELSEFGSRYEDDYVAPNIGLIKFVLYYPTNNSNHSLKISISEELDTYMLK